MKKGLLGFWPPLLVAGVLVLTLTSPFWAGGGAASFKLSKEQGQQLNETLKDVINKGARLFNEQRDHVACYRLFEGALLTTRPLLSEHPDLQSAIDKGILQANTQAEAADKALGLRKVLDQIRERVGPGTPAVKDPTPPDVKPPVKNPPDKVTPPKANTVWDRLGGEANVGRIVDDFITTASKDPKVNFDRDGKYKIDVPVLRKKLIEMVSAYTGGPYKYTGKSMAAEHKGMKITNAEFDAAVGHLKAALQKNNVKAPEVDDVTKIMETTRNQIVEATPAPPKNPPPKVTDPNDKKEPPKVDPKTPPKVDPNNPTKVDPKIDPKVDPKINPKIDPKIDPKAPTRIDPNDKKEPPKANDPNGTKDPVKNTVSAEVNGKLTLEGKPLTGVLLTFVSATGDTTTTNPALDGSYYLKAVAPGKYKVAVRPLPASGTNPPKMVAVPLAYTESASTPLTAEVKAGKNVLNFDLK